MKRGQTSTEYLLITALVVIIAIIVVSSLGLIPERGADLEDRSVFAQLQSEKIGVQSYAVTPDGTYVFLKNNHYEMIRITNITIDGELCDTSNPRSEPPLPITLNVGQERTVRCPGIFEINTGSSYSYPLEITWVEVVSSNRQVIHYPVNLVGTVTGSLPRLNRTDNTSTSFEIRILSPEPIVYSDESVLIEIQAPGSDSIWYILNGDSFSYTSPVVIPFSEGVHSLVVFANNSQGEILSESVIFEIQTLGSPPLFAGGSGTTDDPYQIATCQHLQHMNTNLTAQYVLVADISCSGHDFEPIGSSSMRFTGSLNGAGHSIASISVNAPSANFVGLFGYVDAAEIYNFEVTGLTITGFNDVGFIGRADNSDIFGVHISGVISGSEKVGGLVGLSSRSEIERSSFSGRVTGQYGRIGGIIGQLDSSVIRNVYTMSNVSGQSYVGGLIGSITSASSFSELMNAYSVGAVSGGNGAIGVLSFGSVSNTFWDVTVSGIGSSGSNNFGATGKTTTEMQQQSTYVDWDFSEIWALDSGYPKLRVLLGSELNCADYTYYTCPASCTATCVPSSCVGEGMMIRCTSDCDGPGSCI